MNRFLNSLKMLTSERRFTHTSPKRQRRTIRHSLIPLRPSLVRRAGVLIACLLVASLSYAQPPAKQVTNSVGMKLVFIPPGKFVMGSPENEPGREAQEVQHEVELTKGFYLGAREITVGQFKQFVADTKYQTDGERDGKGAYGANEAGKIEAMHARFTWKTPGFEQTDEHPVVDVSWQDAKAFCNWLSQKEKKIYRLPTEAEWEYASRAGTQTAYFHGDDPEGLATVGNGADATARAKFPGWSIGIKGKDGHLFTAPVGQFKPNAFGVYDMHGNVWEWCEDWYEPNSYPQDKQIDPTGPATGKAKVQRGGGWSSDVKRLRSAARIGRDSVAYRGCYLGFRVMHEPQPRNVGAAESNPQVITARDAKLDKEFEYLVFDLGKGVEFKLVKVKAAGQTFCVGSSKQEQEAVNAKYFNGKQQGKLAMEDEQAVTLTDDFYLGQFEVTRGQFRRFIEETNYQTIPEQTDGGKGWDAKEQKFVGADKRFSWRDTGLDFQTDEYPVVNVAIDDARKFCEWLQKKCDGRVPIREVRLPGEVEWEFACRAGSQTRFFFGDDDEQLVDYANVADASARERNLAPVTLNGKDGFPFSAPVGMFKPNRFGLYDMHGNVWEFCEDYYGKYSALPKERNALQVTRQGEIRPVMRGGAWHLTGSDCRCANRFIVGSTGRYATGGFRVLCLPDTKQPTGGRVAYMLLVNGAVTDAVVKATNIAGHTSVSPPYVGTWHSFVKGMDQIQKGRLDPVERGDIDVMVIGTLMSYPNAETWKNHLGPDDSTLAGLAALGVKNNPKFRIVWQTYVWPVGQMSKDGPKTLDVAAMKKRAASEPLKELEKLVDQINEKQGRKVVLISPVGEATMKLVEMVADGKFPGLTDPAELWTEFNMHSNRHVLALTAYCNVATMYGVSPVGLKPDFSKVTYGGGGKGPGVQSMEGITDEQQAILQRIAWEVVSKYPHAGLVIADNPKSPAGLRVMNGGHSWSTENSAPLCQAAGIVGHKKITGINGNRIEEVTPLLEKGEIDVYVWQHNSVGPEFPRFLPTLVELGPRHNPNFRVIIQMPWLVHDGRKEVKSPEEYEQTDLAEYQTKMAAHRKQQEAYVDEVNAKAGKRVVFLVPLGDGMLEVRKMIVAGKFPGISKQNYRDTPGDRGSVLQGDIMPHQGHLGQRLGMYMHFAALYQMSPEGLKFPGKEGDGLTDDQRAILQKLAWDMVSKYPHAGIAKFETTPEAK